MSLPKNIKNQLIKKTLKSVKRLQLLEDESGDNLFNNNK